MMHNTLKILGTFCLAAVLLLALGSGAQAKIPGVSGPVINLVASDGHILAGDGQTIYMWGFGEQGKLMQYPGPTMILNQGEAVTVNLQNNLTVPVSIIFPGQADIVATGGTQGLVTMEAVPGGSVSYSFTPATPGTYMYQSGTNPALQIEMGLMGALIVRPADFDPVNPTAYGAGTGTEYDYEFLFFNSEVDHRIHEMVEFGNMAEANETPFFPYYWFYNGRTAPDTWAPAGAPWFPHQPYDTQPRIHPNEKMLLRHVGGGRDPHPFHHHGNNSTKVAADGKLLSSNGTAADLAESRFTHTVLPGGTMDLIFDPWIGAELGWDVHGHLRTDPLATDEEGTSYEIIAEAGLTNALTDTGTTLQLDPVLADEFPHNRPFRAILWNQASGSLTAEASPEMMLLRRKHGGAIGEFDILKRGTDYESHPARSWDPGAGAVVVTATYHGAGFPVLLPDQKDLTFGFMYSGSPFLGAMGSLPVGEGGFNVNNGLAFMFHSHNEKEMTNNDIFPGGMMSMMIVEPKGTVIE